MPCVADLPSLIGQLEFEARQDVERLFRVQHLEGLNEVPQQLRPKVARWCGGGADDDEAWQCAAQQSVVSVHSIWTYETANFNTLRARRPVVGGGVGSGGPDEAAAACEGPDKCDFCDVENLTCVEPFGRVRGKHCVTAGNVFKSAGLHGLVIWTRHRLHHLTAQELLDGFEVADSWFDRARAWTEESGSTFKPIYPVMFWNCFRNAGASQVHPHMQLVLFETPVAQGALLKDQSDRYWREHNRSLVLDLIAAHRHCGLALEVGDVACWASLTPRVGGGELCLLGPADAPLAATAAAMLPAMQGLRRCGSEGISVVAFPVPVGEGACSAWFVRLAARGLISSLVTDAGSSELCGLTGAGSDPYTLLSALRSEIEDGPAV